MTEIQEAIDRFDQAAQNWGWQADQGYDDEAINASVKEYDSAKIALCEAFDRAILAENERCAKIAESFLRGGINYDYESGSANGIAAAIRRR